MRSLRNRKSGCSHVAPLAVLSVICLPLFAHAQTKPLKEYQEAIATAHRCEAQYDFTQALAWYQKALALDDRNPVDHLGLIQQLLGLQQEEQAVEELQKLIKRHPGFADAHTYLGIHYLNSKSDREAAETCFLAAMEVDSRSIRPRHQLAGIYLSLQRYDEAQRLYEQILEIAPTFAPSHTGIGQILLRNSEPAEAAGHLSKAIELDPYDPEPYRFLGQALSSLGKREEAQEALRQYQQVKQEDVRLKSIGKKLRRTPHDPNLWFATGQAHLQRNQFHKAIHFFEMGLQRKPDVYEVHRLLGKLYLQIREPQKALPHLEKAIELNPEEGVNYLNLGAGFLMTDQFEAAENAFLEAIDRGMDGPQVRNNLEMARSQLEKWNTTPPSDGSR